MNHSLSSSIIQHDQGSEFESQGNAENGDDAADIADAHQNALLTESDHEEFDGEPELHLANTVVLNDGILARVGMNAEY